MLGAGVGFLLALLMSRFSWIEKTLFPYLMIIQMIPILGMAPIVLALPKDIDKSRIVIAGILTFFPVATNTWRGSRRWRRKSESSCIPSPPAVRGLQKALIPYCMPYLFTGLKIAAPWPSRPPFWWTPFRAAAARLH